jgi:hypothetical protein
MSREAEETLLHVDPFQRSARVNDWLPWLRPPTAIQKDVVGQLTPVKPSLLSDPIGPTSWDAHEDPFHFLVSDTPALHDPPTAMQKDAVRHETEFSVVEAVGLPGMSLALATASWCHWVGG